MFSSQPDLTLLVFRLSPAQNPDRAVCPTLSFQSEVLLPIVTAYRGNPYEVGSTSFCASFVSSQEAAGCAMSCQDALYSYNQQQSEKSKLQLTLAIHSGPFNPGLSPEDLKRESNTLKTCFELLDKATPGSILLSDRVRSQLDPQEIPGTLLPAQLKSEQASKYSVFLLTARENKKEQQCSVKSSSADEDLFPFGGMHLKLPEPPAAIASQTWFVLSLGLTLLLSLFVVGFILQQSGYFE